MKNKNIFDALWKANKGQYVYRKNKPELHMMKMSENQGAHDVLSTVRFVQNQILQSLQSNPAYTYADKMATDWRISDCLPRCRG